MRGPCSPAPGLETRGRLDCIGPLRERDKPEPKDDSRRHKGVRQDEHLDEVRTSHTLHREREGRRTAANASEAAGDVFYARPPNDGSLLKSDGDDEGQRASTKPQEVHDLQAKRLRKIET